MFFSQIIIWIESKNWNFPNFFKNGFKISFSIIYQWLLRNNNCWENCSRRSKELIFSQFSQHDRINEWPNITLILSKTQLVAKNAEKPASVIVDLHQHWPVGGKTSHFELLSPLFQVTISSQDVVSLLPLSCTCEYTDYKHFSHEHCKYEQSWYINYE